MNKLQPKINSVEIETKLYNYFTYNYKTDKVCFASFNWSDSCEDYIAEKCPIKWEDYEEVSLLEFNTASIKFARFLIRNRALSSNSPNFDMNDVIEYLNQLTTLNDKIRTLSLTEES